MFERLVDAYPDYVQLTYRHFPLNQIHDNAAKAAEARITSYNVCYTKLLRGKKSWYASPLKALSNSKYVEFSKIFGSENVGIIQQVSARENNLRDYERGTGETLACGTDACAAVVSGMQQEKLV